MSYLFNKDSRFSLLLLDDWEELNDNDQSIYSFVKKKDPVGALQISLAKKIVEKEPTQIECINQLKSYFQKQNIEPQIEVSQTNFGFIGHAEIITKENRFLTVWLFVNYQRFMFITYNCSSDQKIKELAEIKQMVNSIKLT